MKTAFAAACVLLLAGSANAQQAPRDPEDQPVSGFVVDTRGIFARHKDEPDIAKQLNVDPANMPSRSLGIATGAHVYPIHLGKVAFGFGGHVLLGGGSNTLDPTLDASGKPLPDQVLPTVKRHFRVYTTEVSFNFGHRNGWSYISGGLGRSLLYVDREDDPSSNVPMRQTFHYGAGGRWFTSHHTAVTFEIRWYSVAELVAGPTYVGQPRTTLMVLSGGMAFR
jgi:hypothetical protein